MFFIIYGSGFTQKSEEIDLEQMVNAITMGGVNQVIDADKGLTLMFNKEKQGVAWFTIPDFKKLSDEERKILS